MAHSAVSYIALPLIVGSLLRLADLTRDLGHDEVYTWQVFASASYEKITTSYSVPNNHILHTLLVRLAVQIFGLAEWSLRLPALLSGLVALPLAYVIGRRILGSSATASLTAWIFALSPAHIYCSHSARGYSLLVLLCAMAFYALWRALDGHRLGWAAFALCSFLAAYALPSGALHLAVLGLFALTMCAFKQDIRSAVYALVSGAATLGALIFAYWPMREEVADAGDRWGSVVECPTDLVAAFAANTSYIVTGWAGFLLGLGGLVGLYAAAKYHRPLAIYTGLAWLLPLLIGWAMGTVGQPRAYVFLLLPLALLCAHGAATYLSSLRHLAIVAAVILAPQAWIDFQRFAVPSDRSLRETAAFLAAEIKSGDVVATPYIMGIELGHYANNSLFRGLQGALGNAGLRRLLFVTHVTDARFGLDNFQFRRTMLLDRDNYLESLRLPRAAFTLLHQTSRLAVYHLDRVPQLVLRPSDWRIEHLYAEPTPIYLRPEPDLLEGAAGFKVENPTAARFALHAPSTFLAPADGVALLVYIRSERARTSASLYQDGGKDWLPLQMLRTHAPMLVKRQDSTWYFDAHIIPVEKGKRYGIYVLSWDTREQYMAGFACYFIRY